MIFCADDFGLSDDINRAILELAGSGKLGAVSCMVALERCSAGALAELLRFQSTIDIGLHLCLTDEADLAVSAGRAPWRSFPALLRDAVRGRVDAPEIAAHVASQYRLFTEKCGRRPDFIDGHLHVHQLPGIESGLLKFVTWLPPESRPYVRNTSLPLRQLWSRRLPWVKAAFIGHFGARMRRKLRAASVATNDGFAGIYDFARWRKYPEYLPGFIACLPRPNGILVVHPGLKEQWRRQEFSALRELVLPAGTSNRFQS